MLYEVHETDESIDDGERNHPLKGFEIKNVQLMYWNHDWIDVTETLFEPWLDQLYERCQKDYESRPK